jgi:hypothetical protein
MSKKNGMVKMVEVTYFAGRTVIYREWIEVNGGCTQPDMDSFKIAAECYLNKRRKEALIASDGHTQIPFEATFGELRYNMKFVEVHCPRYYHPYRKA